MKPLPWRRVKFWACHQCGECCSFTVQLTMREWLNLTRRYGYLIADQEIGGFFLRKTINNMCPFLYPASPRFLCSLQATKPLACKMWPFRVLLTPKYGAVNEALFTYRNNKFYVYVIPHCSGITWGKPTAWLINKTLPELIDLRLGFRYKQHFSTSF